MQLIWKYLKNYRFTLFGALILAAINQGFSLLDPQIFRLIIDRLASKFNELSKIEFINGVLLLLFASIAVALISRIAKNFQDYYLNVVVQKLGAEMYARAINHSFSLPYSIFEDQRSGEHLLKLQKARADAQVLVTGLVNTIFFSFIGILFVLVYAFMVNWYVGVVYLAMIPILGFITFFISRRIKAAQSEIVSESAGLAGATTETLRNVELVKSLGLERQEITRLNNVNDHILNLELKKIVIIRRFSFIQGTIINTLRSTLLFLMLWLIYIKAISLGEFFSLYIYSFFIFTPLSELGNVATQYQEARASSEQLEEILKIKPDEKPKNPKKITGLKKIEFKDVSFGYQSSNQNVLDGVNLEVKSGETIALVGPSGSGKSTTVKLIAGLYAPTAGKINYNNIDTSQIDFELFRQKIGLVAQETQLFAGTIRDNLLFIKPDAKDDEIMNALKSAQSLSIVARGDKSLDTKIGEGGLKISGGERQRLAIARALLRDPELLIFDEATSSLDSITEKSITETIKEIEKIKPNLIRILVAHRLSTIAYADRIYVFEKGRIVEQGSHKNLLEKHGLYHALWREQQGESN